jgi:hypothetical protein
MKTASFSECDLSLVAGPGRTTSDVGGARAQVLTRRMSRTTPTSLERVP